MSVYVLTDKKPGNPEFDDFAKELSARFPVTRLMFSLDSSNTYLLTGSYGITESSDYVPSIFGTDLVLINQRVSFNSLAERFSKCCFAGYAHDADESREIKLAFEERDPLVIDRRSNEYQNALRFGYVFLEHQRFYQGLVTNENVDSIIAENLRRGLSLGGCACCVTSMEYFLLQRELLGRKDLGLRSLFRYSPIFYGFPSSDFPLLGKLDPVCSGRIGILRPGAVARKKICTRREKTDKSLKIFIKRYSQLLTIVGVDPLKYSYDHYRIPELL